MKLNKKAITVFLHADALGMVVEEVAGVDDIDSLSKRECLEIIKVLWQFAEADSSGAECLSDEDYIDLFERFSDVIENLFSEVYGERLLRKASESHQNNLVSLLIDADALKKECVIRWLKIETRNVNIAEMSNPPIYSALDAEEILEELDDEDY